MKMRDYDQELIDSTRIGSEPIGWFSVIILILVAISIAIIVRELIF